MRELSPFSQNRSMTSLWCSSSARLLQARHRSRSPRLTWSETSSKSARPAKDFESWGTVSIAESAQCPLVRCPAQLVNHESTRMNTNHKSICLRPGSIDRWPVHAGCQPAQTFTGSETRAKREHEIKA